MSLEHDEQSSAPEEQAGKALSMDHNYPNPNMLVVNIAGDLDNPEEMGKTLLPYICHAITPEVFNVILDLTKVKFIDSQGIAVIVKVYKVINQRKGKVLIVTKTPIITRLFKLTGLLRLIPIYATFEEASAQCETA